MKTEKLNYKFIPVPLRLTIILDEKCTKVLTHLIQLHFAFADENDLFYRSIDLLCEETQLSKRVLNAVLVTLNNLYIVDVYSVGQSKGKKTNQFRINFQIIETYDSIEFDKILTYKIKTLDYTDKKFKVEYHNLQNLITKSDNGSDNNLQNLITKSILEQKLKEYSQNLITKSAKINHNIDNTIIDNTYKNNIGTNNNIIYISEQVEEKEKSNSKVNCFLSDSEIEGYINSSEAFSESETVNNIDNLNKEKLEETNIDNNISTVNLDNTTANAVTEEVDNSNNVIPNYKLDNSNEVNTAVLSPSNPLNEESVISTKKIPENGLKQAKTKELEIINKTDNSNLKNLSTANAVTEEVEESKEVNNSINVNSNNNSVYSNLKNNNTANAVTEKVDNLNSVRSKEEGIEGENKTDNSNLNINNTIAFGDNPTANAVSEFRDKCTKYTIIIEGKETEIDQPIEEYIRCYYNRIMNTIYNTNDFNKKRKIFNKILNENKLFGEQYDEMSDNLDIRYSRYLKLDKQQAKQTDKEEFSNEEIQYIANELLSQCLDFTLTKDNQMQDFYDLRNNYNAFIEEYNIPKEGLKLQKKFAELSAENKKLNTPVSSQSFAN